MITEAERIRLLGLIENCLVYEGQVAVWSVLKDEHIDGPIHELTKLNYETAYKGADQTGQELLHFLDQITEKNNETF